MNKQQRFDVVVSNFSLLERQLSDCMDFLPFIDANAHIVSPRFVPIIVEACALTESIFREMSDDKDKRYSFKQYSELYEPVLDLEETVSLFLGSPLCPLVPFEGWTEQQPDWWKAYNALKHDRLSSYQVATYMNAVKALAALHQTIARCKAFVGSFLRAGWIDLEDGELIANLGLFAHWESMSHNPPIMVIESKLFVSPTVENFVNYVPGDNLQYLDVDYTVPGLSVRVRSLILAHEEL